MDRAHAAGVNTIGRVGDAYRRFIHKVAYAHQGKRENARNEKCKERKHRNMQGMKIARNVKCKE